MNSKDTSMNQSSWYKTGLIDSKKDCHHGLGEGEFDLFKITSYIYENSMVTLEIPYDSGNKLADFERNARHLLTIINRKNGL